MGFDCASPGTVDRLLGFPMLSICSNRNWHGCLIYSSHYFLSWLKVFCARRLTRYIFFFICVSQLIQVAFHCVFSRPTSVFIKAMGKLVSTFPAGCFPYWNRYFQKKISVVHRAYCLIIQNKSFPCATLLMKTSLNVAYLQQCITTGGCNIEQRSRLG